MSNSYIGELPSPLSVVEQDVARRWWVLPPGCLLPLQDGSFCRLLFAGRPGGSSGPDVRDAILSTVEADSIQELHGSRHVGDVEFHVRSSDWDAHGHQHDPRYNNVMLHVVLFCDVQAPAKRQDGLLVPLCSLADLALPSDAIALSSLALWPCQRLLLQLQEDERARILRQAGLLRFEQKVSAFVEQLRAPIVRLDTFDAYDVCLLPALAEALGYGRDRDFFRAAGLRLLGSIEPVPVPLGRSEQPPPLDAGRLHCLRKLIALWRPYGAWRTLRSLFSSSVSHKSILQALRAPFIDAGLSLARSDILLVNVVLPFAAAVALLENDGALFMQAESLYCEHPGLPSNTITRAMCRQLQLLQEPVGSCQQQGLHYIYQQSCREKRCEICLMSKHDV